MRVLLVDDEPALAQVITMSLQAADMEVRWVDDLASARRALLGARFDLMLLDLRLPDGDGRSLLIEPLRLPPVIVLSALGEESDVVELLELGARDYICKPFRTGELLARLRSAVRENSPAVLPIQFDGEAHCINVGRQQIHLSPLECRLITCLLECPDRPVTYDTLVNTIWGDTGKDHAALRVLISQLRQKIEPDIHSPSVIVSDRGIGYRLSTRRDTLIED